MISLTGYWDFWSSSFQYFKGLVHLIYKNTTHFFHLDLVLVLIFDFIWWHLRYPSLRFLHLPQYSGREWTVTASKQINFNNLCLQKLSPGHWTWRSVDVVSGEKTKNKNKLPLILQCFDHHKLNAFHFLCLGDQAKNLTAEIPKHWHIKLRVSAWLHRKFFFMFQNLHELALLMSNHCLFLAVLSQYPFTVGKHVSFAFCTHRRVFWLSILCSSHNLSRGRAENFYKGRFLKCFVTTRS